MGIVAVLVNVLVDKGVIIESELRGAWRRRTRQPVDAQAVLVSRSCWRTC
jgi:hypothetical protein